MYSFVVNRHVSFGKKEKKVETRFLVTPFSFYIVPPSLCRLDVDRGRHQGTEDSSALFFSIEKKKKHKKKKRKHYMVTHVGAVLRLHAVLLGRCEAMMAAESARSSSGVPFVCTAPS